MGFHLRNCAFVFYFKFVSVPSSLAFNAYISLSLPLSLLNQSLIPSQLHPHFLHLTGQGAVSE